MTVEPRDPGRPLVTSYIPLVEDRTPPKAKSRLCNKLCLTNVGYIASRAHLFKFGQRGYLAENQYEIIVLMLVSKLKEDGV